MIYDWMNELEITIQLIHGPTYSFSTWTPKLYVQPAPLVSLMFTHSCWCENLPGKENANKRTRREEMR